MIYRSADRHLHELWWTTGVVTHNDLTVLGAGPNAAGTPSSYLVAADGSQHVIYRGGGGHLHDLRWNK